MFPSFDWINVLHQVMHVAFMISKSACKSGTFYKGNRKLVHFALVSYILSI